MPWSHPYICDLLLFTLFVFVVWQLMGGKIYGVYTRSRSEVFTSPMRFRHFTEDTVAHQCLEKLDEAVLSIYGCCSGALCML